VANCQRKDCGHAEALHSPAEFGTDSTGRCWGCSCPEFEAPKDEEQDDDG